MHFVVTWLGLLLVQSIPPDEIRSHTVPYTPPIRAEVRMVEVPVVVRDKHLHTVAGLTKDDFEIEDNGKKQTITAFSVQDFKPRTDGSAAPSAIGKAQSPARFLALCFDDLHLLPAQLKPVKDSAERFVKAGLAPNDRVIIVRTSRSEHSQFTSDVPTLLEQIGKVTSTPQAVFDNSKRCIHIAPHEAYMIAENVDPGERLLHAKMAECSACYRNDCPEGMITGAARQIWAHARAGTGNALGMIGSLVEGMAKLPGQRLVLLTSGGFLTGTFQADLDRLMDSARRAEVLINSLDARGLYQNASAGTAYDGMGILASGTGGTFFHNNADIEDGFRELGMLPETTYVLGFAPPGAPDGSFHKLKVHSPEGYSTEARLGYNALASNAPATLDGEVNATDAIADLPASFTWEQWQGPPGITMIAHLDIGHLHFKPNQDRKAQKVTFIAILLDRSGGFVAGKRSELQLNLRDGTFAQLSKTGFTAALTLQAPPGSYSVRAVAQDAMDGKLSAASGEVQIK